jgi:putative ABC transport system permease protein
MNSVKQLWKHFIFLFALAMKNLSRYKRRTIITSIALAFGLGLFIFIDAMLLGAELDSERNLLWYETSSARIMHDEYWEARKTFPLKQTVKDYEGIISTLSTQDIPVAPRITFAAELLFFEDGYIADGSFRTRVIAIDPTRDNDVFRFKESITAGTYLEPGSQGVLLGEWFAEDMGLEVGSDFLIKAKTKFGAFNDMELRVAGIINVDNPIINRTGVFMALDVADYFLEMEGEVTEINLKFPLNSRTESRVKEIAAILPANLEVLSWKILAADYVALAQAKQGGSGAVLMMVVLIAAVGISNTMLMAVMERRKELGMMRAMGMTDREVKFAFLMESGGIGIIGGLVGLVIGLPAAWFIVTQGIDFSFILRDMDIGYRIGGVFRGAWNFPSMIGGFIAGIAICVLMAYLATRQALKVEITECLRNE